MANPQKENSNTGIANEIVEILAKTQLNGYEIRYLWVLWRKTYGWQKKEDFIANSQFVELTGLKKQHIWRTEQRLIQRNIVTKNGNLLAFNKDYDKWIELPKMVTAKKVTNSGTEVTKFGIKVTKNGGHNKTVTIKLNNKIPENGFSLEDGITHWNKRKVWILGPGVDTPFNNTVLKKLLKECVKETESLKLAWKKLSPTKEDWELAVGAYVRDLAGRNPNNSYAEHRFSLFEFIKQSNGYITYLNK